MQPSYCTTIFHEFVDNGDAVTDLGPAIAHHSRRTGGISLRIWLFWHKERSEK